MVELLVKLSKTSDPRYVPARASSKDVRLPDVSPCRLFSLEFSLLRSWWAEWHNQDSFQVSSNSDSLIWQKCRLAWMGETWMKVCQLLSTFWNSFSNGTQLGWASLKSEAAVLELWVMRCQRPVQHSWPKVLRIESRGMEWFLVCPSTLQHWREHEQQDSGIQESWSHSIGFLSE